MIRNVCSLANLRSPGKGYSLVCIYVEDMHEVRRLILTIVDWGALKYNSVSALVITRDSNRVARTSRLLNQNQWNSRWSKIAKFTIIISSFCINQFIEKHQRRVTAHGCYSGFECIFAIFVVDWKVAGFVNRYNLSIQLLIMRVVVCKR